MLWLSENAFDYANAANAWALENRGTRAIQGLLWTRTWGDIMTHSGGQYAWNDTIGSRLDTAATQTPLPLYGMISIRDKFWHFIKNSGSAPYSTYSSCIPPDLCEYTSPGGQNGWIDRNDPNAWNGRLADGRNYRSETHRFVIEHTERKFIKYMAKRWMPAIKEAFKATLTAGGNHPSFGKHPNLQRVVLDETSTIVGNITDLTTSLDHPSGSGYPDTTGFGYADIVVEFGQHARAAFDREIEIAYNLNWIPPNGKPPASLQDRAVGGYGRNDQGLLTPQTPLNGGRADRRVGLFAQDLVSKTYYSTYTSNVYSQFNRYSGDPYRSPTSVHVSGETWRSFGDSEFATYAEVLERASDITGTGYGVQDLVMQSHNGTWQAQLRSGKHYHNLIWTALNTSGLSFLPDSEEYNAAPQVSASPVSENQLQLTVSTWAGETYTLERSFDLEHYEEVKNLIGDNSGSVELAVEGSRDGAACFYRFKRATR